MVEADLLFKPIESGEMQHNSVVLARAVRSICHVNAGCKWIDRKLVDQLIRSGTSVGANVREAQFAESPRDFIHKLKIAEKELAETFYWLGVLHTDPVLMHGEEFDNIVHLATSIRKLLRSTIISLRRKHSL
jgi:four helix bundle protein